MKSMLIIIILFRVILCYCQDNLPVTYRIMFYNVENLFYPADDSLTLDDDFTPEGNRHWTWFRYRQKITAVSKVIIAAGEGSHPVLVGLCEVENKRVLEDLVTHPLLSPVQYRYIHVNSPDPRGMDVACLYHSDFVPHSYTAIKVRFPDSASGTRDILHVSGCLGRRDSMDILINHWSSRYGGEVSSYEKRKYQSMLLGITIDSLLNCRQRPFIIAMGDFNDSQEDLPVVELLENHGCSLLTPDCSYPGIGGSYKYQGRWNTIDHFLFAGDPGVFSLQSRIYAIPHIVEPDEKFSGIKPRRTYVGFDYYGGISDHLPLLLDLSRKGHRGF